MSESGSVAGTIEAELDTVGAVLLEDRYSNPNRVEARLLARLGAAELIGHGSEGLNELLSSADSINDTCRTWFAR